MILYSTGYLGDGRVRPGDGKAATFDAMVQRVGLLVCDIRLNPWSVAPCWRREQLRQHLGDAALLPTGRYLHIPALGNLNYRSGGPIKIANLEFGVDTILASCEATGLSPLLLCGCEEHEGCHRLTVGMAFAGRAERWYEITSWVNPVDVNPNNDPAEVFGDDLTSHWERLEVANAR